MNPEMHDGIIGSALYELAIARGALAALDADMTKVYVRDLRDLEPEAVEKACQDLGKEPREEFAPAMPTVGEIRARVSAVVGQQALDRAKLRLLPAPAVKDPNEPTFFCLDCFDESSGFVMNWCMGVGDQRVVGPSSRGEMPVSHCGRMKSHMPHCFTVRCHCYGTNPVVAKRRMREMVRREERKR